MNESCKNCRTWEEEIYWTHFQSISFCQFLHDGFEHQLVLPEKIARLLKSKLLENGTLKNPRGITYNVGLTTKDDTLFFNGGWSQFVKDNLLEKNDVLVFKYDGVSNFDVLMFDGGSMCEKTTSQFVRKSEHREHEDRNIGKPEQEECNVRKREHEHNSEHDARESEKRKVMGISINTDVHRCPIAPPGYDLNGSDPFKPYRIPSSNWEAKPDIRTPPASMSKTPASMSKTPASMSKSTTIFAPVLFSSKRRPVTEDEKEQALFMAQAATPDDGFFVVMKPEHVYNTFYMPLPAEWVHQNLSLEKQIKHLSLEKQIKQVVILHLKDRTWKTRFTYRGDQDTGGLSGHGWKIFARENRLEEFDVCVFEPHSLEKKPIALDVSIYRVLQSPYSPGESPSQPEGLD